MSASIADDAFPSALAMSANSDQRTKSNNLDLLLLELESSDSTSVGLVLR